MIENEHELQAARSWLQYWKEQVADGEQSWLGGENARHEVLRYARAIAEYERRRSEVRATDEEAGEVKSDGASRASQPLEQLASAEHQ